MDTDMAGGITACAVWPYAMPLRIFRAWSRYSACRAARTPVSAPCLMSPWSGSVPASGVRSSGTLSTALRKCA